MVERCAVPQGGQIKSKGNSLIKKKGMRYKKEVRSIFMEIPSYNLRKRKGKGKKGRKKERKNERTKEKKKVSKKEKRKKEKKKKERKKDLQVISL